MLTLLVLAAFGRIVSAGPTTPSATAAVSCAVTKPPDPPFVPPAAFAGVPLSHEFWFGTSALWTRLTSSGKWYGLPRNRAGYRQKIFYWTPRYDGAAEPRPALLITLRPLDAASPPVEITNATNAYFDGMWSMLAGVDFPAAGCWEVAARYRDAGISFVVDVR
jgi:hypothetical protein